MATQFESCTSSFDRKKESLKLMGFSNVSFIIQLMRFGTHCNDWYKKAYVSFTYVSFNSDSHLFTCVVYFI